MDDRDWDLLIGRVRSGKCTPFLGAAASAGHLPLGAELASRWARKHGYPLRDSDDLARVAQFLGVDRRDAMFAKELLCAEFAEHAPPDFDRAEEPHRVLADLPLPIYITTNYDDFMTRALVHRRKAPIRELCRWNGSPTLKAVPVTLRRGLEPTPATPVVFHLHGHLQVPESIVLTEDDYLDFLIAISREQKLLPHQIQRALANTSLLFIGYGMRDWDFRVLHRGLVTTSDPSLRRLSVTVQLPEEDAARTYLDDYFKDMRLSVYWGTAQAFVTELWERYTAAERA